MVSTALEYYINSHQPSTGTTSQAQGRLLRKTKQSPCNPALKGRQSSQKHNIRDVLSANQSPASTRKKVQSLAGSSKSQVENIRENCLSLHESMSPIIGNRRRALQQSNLTNSTVCRDPDSEKEKKAPLKIDNNCQENKISPLQERMNMNMPPKGKKNNEDDKKQAVRTRSVVTDKENVLVTNMAQTSIRKSKRIMVATKNKNAQNILKPVRKKTPNKKQNETKIMSESHPSKKEPDSQPKLQKVASTRHLKTSSSAAQLSTVTTKSSGKKDIDSTCNEAHVATEQESPGNDKENARPNKGMNVLPRRVKRRSGQPDKVDSVKKTNIERGDETPETSSISKRTTRCVSSAKVNKSNRLSSKLLGKSHITSQNIDPSGSSDSPGPTQAKSKPPVWASVRGIKITPGKRKSFRINSDTYEFPCSPHEGEAEAKKKRVTKPRKQKKKKMKPCNKFKLLTTDPSWQGTGSKGMPFLSASIDSTTNRNTASASCYNNSASDAGDEASIPSNMSSIRDEGSAEEEFSSGFEFDGSNTNDLLHGFEGETRSSFVIPNKSRNSNGMVPMTSASVLPTPALSKHISKFIGGSSTPRMENVLGSAANQETRTAEDSIAECFGFDDEPEGESELNISPVQQSRLRHALEVTGTSDITDGELHPASLPSRFSWSSLQPGNRSKASTTRSSSMVAQGPSVTFVTDMSHNSQAKITSFAVPSVGKQHLMPRREKQHLMPRTKKPACQDKVQDTACREAEPNDKGQAAEMSVLFDEDELMEKQSSEDKEASEASHLSIKAPKPSAEALDNSPKKHFAQVSVFKHCLPFSFFGCVTFSVCFVFHVNYHEGNQYLLPLYF